MRARHGLGWRLLLSGCRLGFGASGGADAGWEDGGAGGAGEAGGAGDGRGDAGAIRGCVARCGPSGASDCCASALVPGNALGATLAGQAFYRSYDEAPDTYDDQGYPATVSDFRLDTYEVTVGRFRAFVDAGFGTRARPPAAGAGAHAALAGSGWDPSWNLRLVADSAALRAAVQCSPTYQTWTSAPGVNEQRAMNCVTWYEAMAFCIWDGGYLPTEAEWNYAAAGGPEQRAYPWSVPASSVTIDATRARYAATSVAPVGSTPAGDGRWGHADLAGNVWEWVLDWYADPYVRPCDDGANLAPAMFRVNRGGSFLGVEVGVRTAGRGIDGGSDRVVSVGLRCARAP